MSHCYLVFFQLFKHGFLSSLMVFIIGSLKSLSAETNIWGYIETVSVHCFFPPSMFTHISIFIEHWKS